MRNIIAITSIYQGRKSYVTGCTNRFDGKITPELSTDQDSAKDFLTETEATKICDKLFNPFERKYIVETIKVIQPTKHLTSQTQSWLEQRVMK
jgi:hypothetical protein